MTKKEKEDLKKGIQKFSERFPECFKKKSEKSEN